MGKNVQVRDMVIYLFEMTFIALFGAVLCRETEKRTKLYITLCFFMLTFVAGIRSVNVGVDTEQFCRAYQMIGMTPWDNLFSSFRYEWGFLVLCKVLNYVSVNPQLLIIVSSILINVPLGVFIFRNSSSAALSAFLYVGLGLYASNMNIMREAIAVSFVLIAFEMLKANRSLLFFLFVAIASGFHQTAPFLVILWPLWRLGFNRKTILVYVILFMVAFIFAHQISNLLASLVGREQLYNSEFTGSNYFGALLKALLALFIAVIVLNYFRVGQRVGIQLSNVDQFYCHMLMLWILFSILGMQIQIFSRLCMYFNVFALVGITCALRFIENAGERVFIMLLLGVVALSYFIIVGLFRPEWQGVIPYEVGVDFSDCISLMR